MFEDIGVVVLNAGVGQSGPFASISNRQVEQVVNVNALHVVYSAKVILPLLLKRHEKTGAKSALVVVSSGLGARPIPGFLGYSASKSLVSLIAEGLNYELQGKVDVMSYQAGEVRTKMTAHMKDSFRFINVK